MSVKTVYIQVGLNMIVHLKNILYFKLEYIIIF